MLPRSGLCRLQRVLSACSANVGQQAAPLGVAVLLGRGSSDALGSAVPSRGLAVGGAMPAVIANGQSPRRAPDTLELTDELRGARQQARGVSAQLTAARKAAADKAKAE